MDIFTFGRPPPPAPTFWARNKDLVFIGGACGIAVIAAIASIRPIDSGKSRHRSGRGRRGPFGGNGRTLGKDMATNPTSESKDLQYGVVVSFNDTAGRGPIRPMGRDVGDYITVYPSGLVDVSILESGQRVEYALEKRGDGHSKARAVDVKVLEYSGGKR